MLKIQELQDIYYKKVKVIMKDGTELIGVPDCLCEGDEDYIGDVLRFITEDEICYLKDEEVESYSILPNQ